MIHLFVFKLLYKLIFPVQPFRSFSFAMTIDVDDLVASFSSNHIGQEALDIAALQVGRLLSKHLIPLKLDSLSS